MAEISPGKRLSISAQRDVLCISTPCRSLRIRPDSLRTLKCWESVDFGMPLSRIFAKSEQLCGHSEPDGDEEDDGGGSHAALMLIPHKG